MTIERNQLLDITKTVLNELGITSPIGIELTYAQKVKGAWRVSFNYTSQMSWSKSTGCFAVDAASGEITFSVLDRAWKI